MSHNLMFRVESVELPVTQMCIGYFVILESYVERLIVYYRVLLVMIVLKGSSYLYLQESVYVLLDIAFAAIYVYGKITWLSLVHGVCTCCLFRV